MQIKHLATFLLTVSSLMAGLGDYSLPNLTQNTQTNKIASTVSSLVKGNKLGGIQSLTSMFSSSGALSGLLNQTISIPGIAGFKLECNLPSIPYPDPNSSGGWNICQNANGKKLSSISSALSDGGDILSNLFKQIGKNMFSLGPCKLTRDVKEACTQVISQNYCDNLEGVSSSFEKNSENYSPTILMTPESVISSSAEEITNFGDTIVNKYAKSIQSSNPCATALPEERAKMIPVGSGKTTVADVEKNYLNKDYILKHGLSESGADSIYSPKMVFWKNCIYTHPDHPEICSSKNYRLPSTYADVVKSVERTKTILNDKIPSSTNVFNETQILANNYAKKCKNSSDQAECEKDIYKNGYTQIDANGKSIVIKPSEEKIKSYEDVDKATAYYARLLKNINSEKATYAFMNEDIAQTIPLEKRTDFRIKGSIEMDKEALHDYFIDQINQEKKELIDIQFNLIKISASQFNPKQAMKEVEDMVKSFEQLASN